MNDPAPISHALKHLEFAWNIVYEHGNKIDPETRAELLDQIYEPLLTLKHLASEETRIKV